MGFNNYLFVDTSVICSDYWMRGQKFMLADKAGFTIVLCDAVIQEAKKRFREDLLEVIKKSEKSYRELSRMLSQSNEIDNHFDGNKEIEAYSAFLDAVKRRSTIDVGFPLVAHAEVFSRMIAGAKPFSEDGHRGYADFIIWHSYLAFIKSHNLSSNVFFLSYNTKDFFAHDNKNSIHPNFKEDLRKNIDTCCKYFFYSDFEKLITDHVKPHLIRIEEDSIKNRLLSDKAFRKAIETFVDKEIPQYPPENLNITYYGGNGKFSQIDESDICEIEEITKIDDVSYMAEIIIETIVYVVATLDMSDVTTWTERERKRLQKHITGTQGNKHITEDEATIKTSVRVEFEIEKNKIKIKSKEIVAIGDANYCPYCPYDGDYDDDEDEEGKDDAIEENELVEIDENQLRFELD